MGDCDGERARREAVIHALRDRRSSWKKEVHGGHGRLEEWGRHDGYHIEDTCYTISPTVPGMGTTHVRPSPPPIDGELLLSFVMTSPSEPSRTFSSDRAPRCQHPQSTPLTTPFHKFRVFVCLLFEDYKRACVVSASESVPTCPTPLRIRGSES